MRFLKSIFFLILVNMLVMVTINISWSIASLFFDLEKTYINQLAFFSLGFGFFGAFISLYLSKFFAKMSFSLKMITPSTRDPHERKILDKVYELSRKAKLPKMPEVGIYQSPELNAFATGPSRSNSLVAVSTGLLNKMNDDAVEGVLAHEVSHIANGDMVIMTLIQGVINAIALFASRLLARLVVSQMRDKNNFFLEFALSILFQIALSLLGNIVVCFFSRKREYRADLGGAKLAGKAKMLEALRALQNNLGLMEPKRQEAFNSLKIASKTKRSYLFKLFFATHPEIEDRIQRLEKTPIL